MLLDNRFALETAEGIDIHLTPAGIGPRSLAFVFDLLIRAVILIAAGSVLTALGKFGNGLMLIIVFMVEWFYPVIFEITRGATPGKSAYRLVVVYDNGLPVSLPGSLIRNLFRAIDIMPFGYVLGAICVLFSGRKKRIGDFVAGTMVVYQEKQPSVGETEDFSTQVEDIPLSTEQQAAVVAFYERSKQLSPQRQEELANLMAPVLGQEGQQAVEKLKSMAVNLVGKS